MADAHTQTELNRLYWETDASVSEIADRLDISRRALYEGIDPHPAGEPCPECGADLGYRNRTALENREAECPACGFDTELEPVPTTDAAFEDRSAVEEGAPVTDAEQPVGPPRPLPTAGSGPVLGTAFVAGITIGSMVTYLLRRR